MKKLLVGSMLFVTLISALALGQEYPNDPYFGSQWGLYNGDYPDADIDAKDAWELFKGSNTVKVFITEAGVLVHPTPLPGMEIATGHNDLENKSDYINNWKDWDIYNGQVVAGHGTFVAGVLGAQTNNGIGIAAVDSGVRINCSGALSSGINGAVNAGAEIINMSWRDPDGANPTLISACANAYNHDALLVACMYNNIPPTGNTYYPAGLEGVMAVGATQIYGTRSSFSEYGDHISVVAPGGEQANFIEVNLRNIHSTGANLNIDTTYYDEYPYYALNYIYTPTYKWWGGTSFSAPLVASTASLLKGYAKSKGITLNNDDIRRIIELTASNGYWKNEYTGYGIINARKALDMLNPPYQLCKNSNTVVVLDEPIPDGTFGGFVPGVGFLSNVLRYKITSQIKLPRYYTTPPKVWTTGSQSRGWSYNPAFSGAKNHCEFDSLYQNSDLVWICAAKNYFYHDIWEGQWYPSASLGAKLSCTVLGIPQPPQLGMIRLYETTAKAPAPVLYNLYFAWFYSYGCPTLDHYEAQYTTDYMVEWSDFPDISPNATGWTQYFGGLDTTLYLRMRAVHNDGYITPWSNILSITPPNPDDPIVSETNSIEATIFSNGKKIAVDNAGNVQVVYSSGDSVYYSLSTDNGATWPSEKLFIGMGKYPALELNGKQVPTICWIYGNCLYGSKKEKSGFAKPYLIYAGAEGTSLSSLSYVLNQNTNKAYLGWIEESSAGASLKMSGYNPDTYTLSSTTSIDQGEPGAFKSPSLALDRFGNINIAWGRSGKVYYKDNAGQTEIGQNGTNPNLNIYGDKTTVVWQVEMLPGIYQVVKKTKGPLGWSDKKVISYPDSLNADYPAVAVAGQYVYSKNVKDKDYDLIWNAEYENGWLMSTQNLSSAQGGLSRYPSLAFKQGWPKSKLHILWTEEMPVDDTKAKKPPVKNLSIIVDPVPLFYVDAGTEESVIYTTQRKGNYYYGPHPDYTVDYDPLKLMYSFSGLNPLKDYLIKVTYYHESDKPITQTLAVDNTLNIQSSIEPKTMVAAESWISSNCLKDGKIEVSITKATGDYAVCSVIALYEFDADYSKSAEDIADNSEKVLPSYSYELMQSYPNPTTGKMSIKYQLAQPGKVSLKIYNTLGQMVKTVVEQNQAAGYYIASWDGRDNNGKATANGVYFYRLESGDFKATKKMVVIR